MRVRLGLVSSLESPKEAAEPKAIEPRRSRLSETWVRVRARVGVRVRVRVRGRGRGRGRL